MTKLIAACLVLAAASLLLPSQPSYDPLAWLVWGNELAHFKLDTAGGPSWKPLPVLVTALLAPFRLIDHELPAYLWIAIARAGALLALGMAFRLAARLGGAGIAGWLGGAVAAVILFLTPDWFQFAAHGSEAPIAVAFMLWAVERHLDGGRGWAATLLALASLLRPELFPFLGLYCVWVWREEPELRPVVGGVMVVVPLLWTVPEWLGSGDPFGGESQARSQPAWSLSLAQHPWLRALTRVHNHIGPIVEALAGIAVVAAAARWRRPGSRATLLLAGAALAEIAVYVGMTEAGFSGNPRYVLPALALIAVLAGVGAAQLAHACSRLAGAVPRLRPPALAGTALAVALLAFASAGFLDSRVHRLRGEAHEVGVRMQVHSELVRAVRAVGGATFVTSQGFATANRALQTRLAWELGVPIGAVESTTDYRIVFRSSHEFIAGRVKVLGRARQRPELARVGSIVVYRRDDVTFPQVERQWAAIGAPFTRPLQGFHTLVKEERIRDTRVVTR
jgi:hypothetical protein